MTPEEIARMQAGVDPRAYYSEYDIARRVRAGELPEELLAKRGATTIPPGTTGTQKFNPSDFFENMMNRMGGFGKNIDEPGGILRNKQGAYRRAGGGKLGAGLGALETTLQDPVAGIISAPIGIAGGQLANVATNALTQGMMQGPLPLKAAGMALRYLAPSLVGYQTQQAAARGVQGLMGTAPQTVAGATSAGAGGLMGLGSGLQDFSLNLPLVGNIPIGQRAKRRAEAAYGREQTSKDLELALDFQRRQGNLQMNQNIAEQRAINQIQTEAYLNQMKGQAPILADMMRQETVARQSLLNTQGAINQRLARLAGTYDLANRSMAEAGAYARTVAATSPLNAPLMEAPNINFG